MPLLEDYAAYDLPDASFIFLSLDPWLQKNAHIAQAGGGGVGGSLYVANRFY